VLPVDRESGRPRGFAFVEFAERSQAEQAIQRFNGQVFGGRPLAVSEARAREDRGPRPGGFSGPRPGGATPGGGGFAPRSTSFGGPRAFEPGGGPAIPPSRSRNFGPDAKPSRGNQKSKKKEGERPRGPIPLKRTGRSLSLDDDSPDDAMPDIDDFATSQPREDDEDEA
jgi:RNA recognition motif-containing protein